MRETNPKPTKGIEPSKTNADGPEYLLDESSDASHCVSVRLAAGEPAHFALLIEHHRDSELLDLLLTELEEDLIVVSSTASMQPL